MLVSLTANLDIQAQCSLACNGTTQVSLSSACDALITPSMILSDNGTSCMGGSLSVSVSDDYGTIPLTNIVTNDYVGQTLTAMVIDANSGNTCWGYIIIEDKLGPNITDCPMGFVTMDCPDMNMYPGPTFTDNCSGELTPVLLSEDITTPCLPNIIKRITRVYSAVDDLGNQAANTCTVRFQLLRFNDSRVSYPDSLTIAKNTALDCGIISDYDANDNGRIDEGELTPSDFGVPFYRVFLGAGQGFETLDLFPYPDIYCNTVVTYEDVILPKIGCTQKIMRRWQINEWHCDGEMQWNYTQLIEITDNLGPSVSCLESVQLTTNTLIPAPGGTYGDFNCGAKVQVPLPSGSDNCASSLQYHLAYNTGFVDDYKGEEIVLPMGTNVVLFTVYDDCYNSSTCHIAVDIVDDTPPIAICDQNTTVSLTSGGTAVVNATSFDDGSYDDCKLHCSLVRRMDATSCPCSVPEFCDLTYLGNRDGNNYYLSDYQISGDIAKNRASSYGGNLVTFENADEETWLIGEVRKRWSDRFWIGIKRNGNSFVNPDHSSLSYTNWAADQPSLDADEDCVMVTPSNQWNDAGCASEQRYVMEIPEGCGFSNGVKFCCEDADLDHMVVLRAIDFYGNHNDCMVNISVQDKSAPSITCPPNMTVSCDLIYSDLDAAFGELKIGESCGSNINVVVTEDLNECGSGSITRIWEALGGSQVLSHCKQIITFENDVPFNGDNIICPEQEITVNGCNIPENFGPEVTGTPQYTGGACDILGADYDDQVFTFNNSSGDACFKILREWEIIDWCQVNPATANYYTWKCHQVIKISNSVRPVISGDQKINVCSYDADCANADVELEVWGEDDCTTAENLRWSYSVFLGSLTGGPTDFSNPATVANGTGDHIVASGKYPLGSHVIRWTFLDGCGNSTTSDQEFTVSNCKAATAYCINGLAVDLMPIYTPTDTFGMIELWASDFDAGSYHPCGYPVELSFSADVTDKNKTFDCVTRGNQIVEIWASVTTPTGELVQTYCSTFIDIQDNTNACSGRRVLVDGSIYTEEMETVENVRVDLEGAQTQALTANDGTYAFPNMPTGGDYIVSPYSNNEPLNGVSTIDLINIQRHILGVEPFDSPYKFIAADIDNNKIINGVDLVELRKLILGIYKELPSNDSWRFVDVGYTFEDPSNPFNENIAEDYEISSLASDMAIDFIAVKIGDLNSSAEVELGAQRNVESQVLPETTFEIENTTFEAGEIVRIPFSLKSVSAVQGFQFSSVFNSELLEVIDVQSSSAQLAASNFVIENNTLKISWNNVNEPSPVMFEVVAIAKETGELQGSISLSNDLPAEIYTDSKNAISVGLYMKGASAEGILLTQNSPNPFSDVTEFQLHLDNDSKVEVSVTNLQGKVVMANTKDYKRGVHTLRITENDLGATGVYYLNVRTDKKTKTIKMILID